MKTPKWMLATVLALASPAMGGDEPAIPAAVAVPRPAGIRIPFGVDGADRDRFEKIELHVSIDGGKSWRLAGTARPEAGFVAYRPDGDGVHDFACRVVLKDGRSYPEETTGLVAALSVTFRGGVAGESRRHEQGDRPKSGYEALMDEVKQLRSRVEALEKALPARAEPGTKP